MAQKKDLNISPYYDDYDSSKNFHKVLFKPGYPVQARELTTLQSIMQNQIEQFGKHMFKEGSVVIPGGITFDDQYSAVKLSPLQFGIDVSIYASELVDKVIEGRSSGITATVQQVVLPNGSDVEYLTLYVKYSSSSPENFSSDVFTNGESLIVKENVVYGNTTIGEGQEVATLISEDATSTGSSVSISDGVFFIRGTFVNVTKQTLILDYYTNSPSYRVGLKIDELIIGAKDDPTLYDNAQGFTNYAAPGADRFKISLSLTKKGTDDYDDSDFVEVLKVVNGQVRKIQAKSSYNIIEDYLAERTYEESGNYTVEPFDIKLSNSLNNRLGNGGVYFADQKTDEGETPTDDLACLRIGGGTAYVRGYQIDTGHTTAIDVPKPRDTQKIDASSIPFSMGNRIQLQKVVGQPQYRKEIALYNGYSASTLEIGRARVYNLSISSEYVDDSSKWNLYLYDVQTFTRLSLNRSLSSTEVLHSYHVKGGHSGATGYVWNSAGAGNGGTSGTGNDLFVEQTSGRFLANEPLIIQGNSIAVQTLAVKSFGIKDVKYVKQTASGAYTQDFGGFAFLDKYPLPNGIKVGIVTNSGTTLRSPGAVFTGITTNTIIRYSQGSGDEIFANVSAISPDGYALTLAPLGVSVAGIFSGTPINTSGTVDIAVGAPSIREGEQGSLYSVLPDTNISAIDFDKSTLTITAQITGEGIASSTTTLDISGTPGVKDGSGAGISTAFFDSFAPNRYSVHYGSGNGVAGVKPGNFSYNTGGSQVVIGGLNATDSDTVVNVTAIKQGIQSKVKNFVKSNIIEITASKLQQSGIGTGIQDGLTWNPYAYGLRVQDREISLNVPDVSKIIAIRESTNEEQPTFDIITFSATAAVASNAIIGEDIVGDSSNAIARVVTNNGSTPSSGGANKLGIVYLNDRTFQLNEIAKFTESNITSTVEGINATEGDGKYQDISRSFTLDEGQRDQYYDYSRLVRKRNSAIPSKRMLVVFDKYVVPSGDKGDVFTVMSYDKARYNKDIPSIGINQVRATDALDFRPRVPDFTSNTVSPFSFDARTTQFNVEPKFLLAPNEQSILGYEYYLPRIDKLYIDKNGTLSVVQGQSERDPLPPSQVSPSMMELATIAYPAYLYNPGDADIYLTDNRRYTMRDIGKLENRIEGLERTTTLSLLEVNTEAFKIQDSQGNDRFKSGFFVDDFQNNDNIDLDYSSVAVDERAGEIRPIMGQNSLESALMPASNIVDTELDRSEDFALLDGNVVKRGDSVLLDFDEVPWINQPLATRVENVNPFHVIDFRGLVDLTPISDSWLRTIRLDPMSAVIKENKKRTDEVVRWTQRKKWTSWFWSYYYWSNGAPGTTRTTSTEVRKTHFKGDVITSTGDDQYMRSRNTTFDAKLLKPTTQHYQFMDNQAGMDFIPKLLEISNDTSLDNYGSVGVFQVGEEVLGYDGNKKIVSFRVANQNHKTGPYNNPKTVYTYMPYKPAEQFQATYTSSSKVVNVDCFALSEKAQGKYSGYVVKGAKLVGQTSGAVAYVKDLRLVTDNFGDLQGSWYLRDPFVDPQPSVVIPSGNKEYKITGDATNAKELKGSKLISSASINFQSMGTFREIQYQDIHKTVTTKVTTITRTYQGHRSDPLAQSFAVATRIQAPDSSSIQSQNINLDDDQHGAFLTSVDLFFAKKPPTGQSNPVVVQVRTVELGTPTLTNLNLGEVVYPDDITTSDDGSVATNVKFKEPIYVEAGKEYAIVLLATTTDQYEVWIARMGETVTGGATGDGVGGSTIIYTQQWALGSLYKSQNGSIWEPSQMEDMKMKLYKARFKPNQGTAYFSNPTLNESNDYIKLLDSNPITTLAKTGKIAITNLASGHSGLTTFIPGTKIVGSSNDAVHGYIVGTGASVTNATIARGGVGYNNTLTDVSTYNLVGQGEGFKIKINSVDSNGAITGFTTAGTAKGYKVGDVVGIVTADVSGNVGAGAFFTIEENSGLDTLYLSGIQGSSATGSFKDTEDLRYADPISGVIQNASTGGGPVLASDLTLDGGLYDGKHFRVSHFNHGMHATNNKLKVFDVAPNAEISLLSLDIDVSASSISVGSTVGFSTFEGAPIGVGSTGYARIGDEIIGYRSVGNGSLDDIIRGVDNTTITPYSAGEPIEKYELNGVSLRRINNFTHQISPIDIGLNHYYVGFDTTSGGKNRSIDAVANPELSFIEDGFAGGDSVRGTMNIQFETITPCYDVVTPSPMTSTKASIRTVTGTSVSGNEVSFQDQGFQPVQLNTPNDLTTPRIVCSQINETTYLGNIERNKSFTTGITLETKNQNVSPIIYTNVAYSQLGTNMIDKPVSNYPENAEVKTHTEDPHAAIYVSRLIKLNKSADSLKVLLTAYRGADADFRVLYSLQRPDSMEILQEFELFPGYNNLKDTTGDGLGNLVIDETLNSGLPDAEVTPSLYEEYKEYEFTADNLGEFDGYVIKIVMSSTNQAEPVKIRDIRTIAVK